MKKQLLYALGLALVALLAITGCTIGPEDPPPDVSAEEEEGISQDAAALATITAAPEREAIEPTAEPTAEETEEATSDDGNGEETSAESGGGETATVDYDPADIAAGEATYTTICFACHGADARGVPNLGKDLVASEFVATSTDQELLTMIKTGRPIWDPLNTTGVDMPAKGGNPMLTDEQILQVIAFLRSLQAAEQG